MKSLLSPWVLVLLLLPRVVQAQERPNVVLVVVDDLGWDDLSCMGSRFYQTPHIDRLAAEGARFTQAYSACTVCSPSRAALMTGKYPARLHITDFIPGHRAPRARLQVPDWTQFLPESENTVAELLRRVGYRTGQIGKWHLGKESPAAHGFDVTIGGDHRGLPPSYFAPYRIPSIPEKKEKEYLTDREVSEAVSFIEANRDRPFFLYLAHYAVHTPIQAKEEKVAPFRGKSSGGQTNAAYAGMVASVDEGIGRILETLGRLGIDGRTVLIFTSDNGGLGQVTSNAPLRAGKGTAYEGGVRVPLLVRWPGKVPAGSVVRDPVIGMDLFSTVIDAAGLPVPEGVDGWSLLPVLLGRGGLGKRTLFWHYPHYHTEGARPYGALRRGDLRYINFYEDGHEEVYDLAVDPSEKVNLANQAPARTSELRRELEAWRQSLGAQMPSANPGFDPAREIDPPHVVRGEGDRVVLHGRDVEIHGANVRYEPQPHKNTVGYWTRADDWVSWDLVVTASGRYHVDILQGCGPGSGGSEVEFKVGEAVLRMVVEETRGFQDFKERRIGTLDLGAGRHRLEVRPVRKPGVAVMDLRQVALTREP